MPMIVIYAFNPANEPIIQDSKKMGNTPPPLRDAATIILVREKNDQLETYLLRRSTQSGFMGGLFVFPGGTVDEQDRDIDFWQSHIDLSLAEIENRLCTPHFKIKDAIAFSTAAIRETLEEAGVLIASANDKSNTDFQAMADRRLEKDLDKHWFKNSIHSSNWTLLFSSLGGWSHWITPEKMKKRFDTRFFIVVMPENQTCAPDNLETSQGIWITPINALEKNLTEEVPLSPPAVVTLTHLLKYPTMADLEAEMVSHSWGDPIAPVLYPTDNGPVIVEPWDPQFGSKDKLDFTGLDQKVLPASTPFSRIWCDKGIWKPVDL